MLGSAKMIGFVGVRDAAAAKTFYRDKLGLTLESEDKFALVLNAGGNMLRVTPVRELRPVDNTVPRPAIRIISGRWTTRCSGGKCPTSSLPQRR